MFHMASQPMLWNKARRAPRQPRHQHADKQRTTVRRRPIQSPDQILIFGGAGNSSTEPSMLRSSSSSVSDTSESFASSGDGANVGSFAIVDVGCNGEATGALAESDKMDCDCERTTRASLVSANPSNLVMLPSCPFDVTPRYARAAESIVAAASAVIEPSEVT